MALKSFWRTLLILLFGELVPVEGPGFAWWLLGFKYRNLIYPGMVPLNGLKLPGVIKAIKEVVLLGFKVFIRDVVMESSEEELACHVMSFSPSFFMWAAG